MDELKEIILVSTGGERERKQLTDNKKSNTSLLNEVCDKMHDGSMAGFAHQQYAPCSLFHLIRDVYHRFPDLVDLEAIYNHAERYERWAFDERKRDMMRVIEWLKGNKEKIDEMNRRLDRV